MLLDFRARLFGMEADGCLAGGGAQLGVNALTDMLALDSYSLYLSRYGKPRDTASKNIEPGLYIRVVSPLLRAGSKDMKLDAEIPEQQGVIRVKVSDDYEGFETCYYAVEQAGAGASFRLESVEHNRAGKAAPAVAPVGFRLEPPPSASNFRVLLLSRRSASDRDLTLLGARSRAELDAAQQRIESATDSMAACRADRSVWCQPIPRLSAIESMLKATVNGKPVFVYAGGTVGQAIQAAGFTPQPGKWTVERPWQGQLIPILVDTKPEALLRVVLIGGERITSKER